MVQLFKRVSCVHTAFDSGWGLGDQQGHGVSGTFVVYSVCVVVNKSTIREYG